MTLGRHVSQVKSLSDTDWSPKLLELINKLYSSGSNGIWEHTASQSSKPRKPCPTDPLNPTKEDFIRAKYQELKFVNPSDLSDLSQQLHSSVRTSNLKTSLRLLALGADVDYLHPEKGTRPLNVAIKSNQPLQLELLLLFGADPLARDSKGLSPKEYATAANAPEIIERLQEAPLEIINRLSRFACGKKANHDMWQNLSSGERANTTSDSSQMLRRLSDKVLTELMRDLHDEVDRREVNQEMSSVKAMTLVPFLPISQCFSRTRNQSRQKLATLLRNEFTTLLVDVLSEFHSRNSISVKVTTL